MYAGVDDLKQYLGIATTSTSDDELLDALLERSQEMIDSWAGWTFEALADSTRYFDAYRNVSGGTLYLDRPLVAITSVTNGNGVVIASTSYVTRPRNETPFYALRPLSSSGVTWEPLPSGDYEGAIAITGRWAYSKSAPLPIAQATIRMAAFLYRQRDNTADLDRAIVTGNATILPSDIPRDIAAMISPFRRIGIGR